MDGGFGAESGAAEISELLKIRVFLIRRLKPIRSIVDA
jgi:hypothetical protein